MTATPSPSLCRFGPFLLDRTRYQVRQDADIVALTPKLIDLLCLLVDHAGELVTKEQLLDALWPGANVTDNALTQAVSELRAALGDDPGASTYIKTVARRGYRFVAEVTVVAATAPARTATRPAATPHTPAAPRTIAVMDFSNLSKDPDAAWLSAGIAETVAADLGALGRFRIVDRQRVSEALRRTDGSMHAVANELGVEFAVVGSYQTQRDRIRITSRIVDVAGGEAIADAKVDGLISDIFVLQDEVVSQFAKELGLATSAAGDRPSRETASLEAYRRFTEGWLELEALDVNRIPVAIEHFQRAIALDPRYAVAHAGLANAQLAAYEDTRAENTPAAKCLDNAVASARSAVALDATLAEAQATLAFVLVSAWKTGEACEAARRAIAIDPGNWKHHFRLGHASWGDERLRASDATLSLYPDFAFAHFQAAMVHIARGHLRQAETVLRQGAAIQVRQSERGERYPALGLHWLLALVRLAQDDAEEALKQLEIEQRLSLPQRLYGREYRISAASARGACYLRLRRPREAAAAFEEALAIYPRHAQSLLGLGLWTRFDAALEELGAARPIEAAIVRAQADAVRGREAAAVEGLGAMLATAPPGFAGWTLQIEPFLHQIAHNASFVPVAQALAQRAE